MAGEAVAYAYEYVFDDENSYHTEEVDNWDLQTQPDCAYTEIIRELQVC